MKLAETVEREAQSSQPCSWKARIPIAILAVALISVELPGERIDLSTTRGWVDLLTPYVPLAALLFGPIPAAITWCATVGVLLAMGAQIDQMTQLVIPSFITLALCTFLLPLRWAIVFAVTALAMLPVSILINPESGASTLIQTAFWTAGIAAGISLNIYRARQERSEREILLLEERQRSLRFEERDKLAQELHDIVAHEVTIIAMQSQRAAMLGDPEKTAHILQSIRSSAQQALGDLRNLVLVLRERADDAPVSASAIPAPLPLTLDVAETPHPEASLASEVGSVVRTLALSGFVVQFRATGEAEHTPPALRQALQQAPRQALRQTIRELASNVLKHADAQGPVDVTLSVSASEISLEIINTPSTTTPVASSHTGLETIRARCESFDGSVSFGEQNGRWTTRVVLPVNRRAPEDTKNPQKTNSGRITS